MITRFLASYFGFNRQQRNGLFVLILLSFLLLIVRIVYPYFIQPDPIVVENLPLMEEKIESGVAVKDTFRKFNKHEEKEANFFNFNPNKVSLEQLMELGFKEKAAKRFIKFRSKGFVFKTKQDLKKLYGLSEEFYMKLEPYILIESQQEVSKPKASLEKNKELNTKPVQQKQTPTKTELNSADSAALIAINGIGPAFAKRIIKYRNALGGFVSLEQLKEVYGFTEEIVAKLIPNFYLNTSAIKKLNLNKDDFKTINKHPYITYELTKSIFDWRRKTSINTTNLKGIINDDVLYQKLLPYLAFE